ncbi:hypothetical protein LSH36_16g13045 [Paralvinella palmiformis]|uniref:Uncharacterized protein n=1 Tax=Paralvinella palmiformis TaxID=53620 RepID=A0AAD9KC91_9ANNE|nr:hypothetical protein LSH36_16g13045 [Paralvinella palmiformis]
MSSRFHVTRSYICSRRLTFELLLILIIVVLLTRLHKDDPEGDDARSRYGWYTTDVPESTTEGTTQHVPLQEPSAQKVGQLKVDIPDVNNKKPTRGPQRDSPNSNNTLTGIQKVTGHVIQKNRTEVLSSSNQKNQ